MEYRIERKVSFIETGYIEADSIEELEEKLKTAELDWDVVFDEYNPEIECITVYDEDGDEIDEEFPADIMEEDYIAGMNGCIIYNQKKFNK